MTVRHDFAERVANYSRRARQLQKLSASRRRLRRGAAYASAAGAAVAAASAAEATIVWSGDQSANAMVSINGTESSVIAFKNLATATDVGALPVDIQLRVGRFTSTGIQSALLSSLNGLLFAGNNPGADIFASGSPITGSFGINGAVLATYSVFGGLNAYLTIGVPGFVGFQTAAFNKGWIKVQWDDISGDGLPDKLTAIEWAYNDDPMGSIFAGQTAAVPEAGAAALVGLVACGCAGVMALKKLRKTA